MASGGADLRFLIPGESLTWDHGQEQDEFGSTSRQGKLLRISGWINLDSKASLGCVGAVLTYLQRRRSAEYLQDDPDAQQAYRVTSMEMFSLQGTMYVPLLVLYTDNCAEACKGPSTQTHCSRFKLSSPNHTLMRSTRDLAPLARKSLCRSMVFSITWLGHRKAASDFGNTSCAQAWTWKRSMRGYVSSQSSFVLTISFRCKG